jgi:hypothetical protein
MNATYTASGGVAKFIAVERMRLRRIVVYRENPTSAIAATLITMAFLGN